MVIVDFWAPLVRARARALRPCSTRPRRSMADIVFGKVNTDRRAGARCVFQYPVDTDSDAPFREKVIPVSRRAGALPGSALEQVICQRQGPRYGGGAQRDRRGREAARHEQGLTELEGQIKKGREPLPAPFVMRRETYFFASSFFAGLLCRSSLPSLRPCRRPFSFRPSSIGAPGVGCGDPQTHSTPRRQRLPTTDNSFFMQRPPLKRY